MVNSGRVGRNRQMTWADVWWGLAFAIGSTVAYVLVVVLAMGKGSWGEVLGTVIGGILAGLICRPAWRGYLRERAARTKPPSDTTHPD
jgi:hypothetical protein